MTSLTNWLHAFRLRTLPLSLSGIIVGSAVALNFKHWNTPIFVFAITTTLLFQILSNLANDLGDSLKGADNSQRVGPMRSVQSGAISIAAMKRAVVITAILSFISAGVLIYLGTQQLSPKWQYFYIGLAIACVVAAISYTVGKRAYGYHGLGDVFVFIFFGLVSVLGVYPLFANGLEVELIFGAVTIGALSTAVLNLNNMRDCINDEAVGKRTLVVILGLKKAKIYHISLLTIAMASWLVFVGLTTQWLGILSVLPFIIILKHTRFVMANSEPPKFDPELKKVALSTFFIAVLYLLPLAFLTVLFMNVRMC